MNTIAFIDTEIDPNNGSIRDLGAINEDGGIFHENSIHRFVEYLKDTSFICGHNIQNHDIKYLSRYLEEAGLIHLKVIDTLYLSPLLFPKRPYHHLLKDEKLQTDELNNPVSDSIKAKDLFFDEINAFTNLEDSIKQIFFLLLKERKEFRAFFNYISFQKNTSFDLESLIKQAFGSLICGNTNLPLFIERQPVELAYCLALIHCQNRYSITPPWVLKNYPEVERLIFILRDKPCIQGCSYCDQALDPIKGLQRYFGYPSFRTYAGEPLQENAVRAAINNKSILAVFPTGGGKSITFQVPALMSGENSKGLTVVISPLQSLMKDQVDNLEKLQITDAVTINGLLDPVERSKSFERVEDGSASILYISPESLRSKTIERLLLGRKITRFVIDEAHCFSSWGQDFRVDYLYIGDFIKSLQEKKNLQDPIPVSCFTATAKQKVIEDIRTYFKEKLSLDLELFRSKASRTNLHYEVFISSNEEDKYLKVRNLLQTKNCPCIIYVSRTHKAMVLAERLNKDGFNALPYHGKMDKRDKTANQNAFISGKVQIMVATSAFGMGVDKKDVGMVIHYEISDSLENYVQEAGRAGRDENISDDCFVMFDEEDLGKHFILLNQTKLNLKEIQQIWKAIKDLTRFRASLSNSALEIARKAGWDESIAEIETRVTTAIAALEQSGYVKRGQNIPRVFANSILSKTAQEAIDKINNSPRFDDKQKEKAIRIIKKLISSKSRKQANDEVAESRVDYISDHLGIVKEDVIKIITLLREEKILADNKDLTAYIKKGENKNRSLTIVNTFKQIEECLFPILEEQEKIVHLKELNELALNKGCSEATPNKIKTVLNFWAIKNWIKRQYQDYSKNHVAIICTQPKNTLAEKQEKRHDLAQFIVEYLHEKALVTELQTNKSEEVLVEFSVHELIEAEKRRLFRSKYEILVDDIEDTLFYLSRIDAIKIEGGFLVVYNSLTVERTELNNKIQYKTEDYQKLNQFYQNKIQQIHIVGEYAKKMVEDYKGALQFVEDYFQLNYPSFLAKYFPGSRENEINRNLTPAKFKKLFGELSPTQLKIINDKESKYIVVAAGPGSGKTKVLAHKLASLVLMEDVKYEQLLMLTFSRAAATEFKKRLLGLIGNAANFVEIKTFHSYAFDLLGKVGNLEKSEQIIQSAIDKIKNGEVEPGRITKTVLVIDEAQDMSAEEFGLVNALMEQNEEMRVIAVGDDDQNIFTFRKADSKYLGLFISEKGASKYELTENFRSKSNLVSFANQFVSQIHHRLKEMPIVAKQQDGGNIRLFQYTSGDLTSPLTSDIVTNGISGSTGVLTKTNEEALQIAGLLTHKGIPAKIIQSHDEFNLYNLLEIRYFIEELNLKADSPVISDEEWENAKKNLTTKYKSSSKFEICQKLIRDFEDTNTKKKYKSDLEVFIRESKLEDFIGNKMEIVLVSTIHKAKGKEFDNVFLLHENFNSSSDDAKRQLYVAITRAKQNLTIHTNNNCFENIATSNLFFQKNTQEFSSPGILIKQLTHRDVYLNYFESIQNKVSLLRCGESLSVNTESCLNTKGEIIVKFSRSFIEFIVSHQQLGYKIKEAKVNLMVWWKKPDEEKELIIILPELCFEKNCK
jgi:ATP-dependent DNA helicase RecQ